MNYTVRITPKALADLNEIIRWYDSEQVGLGAQFDEEFFKTSQQIASYPFSNPSVANRNVRRGNMSRFPYSIFYRVIESQQRVDIVIVVHQSRHPKVWRQRF